MKRLNLSVIAGVSTGALLLACAGSAQANAISIASATPGGATEAQAGATIQTFDSLTAGQNGTIDLGNGLTIILTPNAAADAPVSGSSYGVEGSSQPYGDNSPWVFAGVTTSYPAASIYFNFSTGQTYLGLLWGSVDQQNTLTFYSGPNGTGTVLGTITGTDVHNFNNTIAQTGYGDQDDSWGAAYVNFTSTTPFESVEATSSLFTFEIDNVAYGAAGVPDGGTTIALLGMSLLGLSALRRNLSSR
jgi:hypothetical protein